MFKTAKDLSCKFKHKSAREKKGTINALLLSAYLMAFGMSVSIADDAQDKSNIKFGGRLQSDYAWIDDDVLEHRQGFEVRRARLYFSSSFLSDWDFKAQYDFKGDGEWKDLYIGYSGLENTYIQAGQIFEMVGLEGYTSSKNLTFIERSLPVAFVPDRALGLSVVHWTQDWMFAGGFYGRNLRNSSQNTHGASARFAWSQQSEANTIHLGASFAQRSPDKDTYRVRTRAESHVTDTRLIDTEALTDVGHYTTAGFEFAWINGPFSLQSEYIQQSINRTQNPNLMLSSSYIYTSYFLTGESRSYNQHYGALSSTTPLHDDGAWEIGLRFSTMDLNDGLVQGGNMDNWTLGLNWYLSKSLKFAFNYIDSTAKKGLSEDNPKIAQLRFQYVF